MKFKATISSPQTSMEHPSMSNNNIEEMTSTASNRRRPHASSDYPTDVTLFNSKSDSWALNFNDETTQTGTIESGSVQMDYACTDAERQQQRQQQQQTNTTVQDDDLIDPIIQSRQRLLSNHHLTQPTALKPLASNLSISTENPWKKLSNVRYKLDDQHDNQGNQRNGQHIRAEHVTFV